MVRRKDTQKIKSKQSATSLNILKETVKSTNNLSNVYKNTAEDFIESDRVELFKPVATIAEASIKRITKTKTISSSKSSDSIKPESSMVLATPENGKNAIVANENQTVNDKSKVKENVKIISQTSKSQKRKAVPKKKEVTSSDKASRKSKTEAKKQKIELEVPSLRSLPSEKFVVAENDVGQLDPDEDMDCKEKSYLLELPNSIDDMSARKMHSDYFRQNGENIIKKEPEVQENSSLPGNIVKKEPEVQENSSLPGELLLPKLLFVGLMKEIVTHRFGQFRWEARALLCLQEALESHIVSLLEGACEVELNGGRASLKLSDVQLAAQCRERYECLFD